MWAKHDVFGTPLPPRHHLQPQLVSGLLVLTHLLPPRRESTLTFYVQPSFEVRSDFDFEVVFCRFVVTR